MGEPYCAMSTGGAIIKRGGYFRGWWGIIPGAVVIILLIFLPGFISLVGAVLGYGANTGSGDETIARYGGPVLLRALVCGITGGILALRVGLFVALAMTGSRFKLPVFIILCLPAVIGEAAAATAFGSTAGRAIEQILPSHGYLALFLYIAWRLTGPVALVATLLTKLPWRKTIHEPLRMFSRMLSGWKRWRKLAGVSIFAGLLVALSGAGHIQLGVTATDIGLITGPAEFTWMEPLQPGPNIWAVLMWPLYIISAAACLVFVMRLCAAVHRKDYSGGRV